MMPSRLRLFRWALLAPVVAVMTAGCGTSPVHPAVGIALGPLPIAPITNLAAAPPALTGRVTLLNFWGTWCRPCRRELPGLARLAEGLAADRLFQLVAVSCSGGGFTDPADLAAETGEFLLGQKLPIAAFVLSDPLTADMLATSLGLRYLPATYLVGPDATVREVWIGYRPRDEAEMAAAIVRLLKEVP